MNSLSWLIYLAGATGSLSGFLTFVVVVLALLTAMLTLVALFTLDETDKYGDLLSEAELNNVRRTHGVSRRSAIRFGILFLVLGTATSLLPDRKTVLLIAASEIGERMLTSDRMARLENRVASVVDPSLELLNTWINQQTESIRREMESNAKSSNKR